MTPFNLNYLLKGSISTYSHIGGESVSVCIRGLTIQFLTDGFAEVNKPREEIIPVE